MNEPDVKRLREVETEKVVQKKRDEIMQAELERYMTHAVGYRPNGRLYAARA
jgi:hypothetical protein